MAVYDSARFTRPAPATSLVSALLGRLMAWNDRRLTVKALSRLTDRELNDIGLKRGDLDTLAR